MGPTRWCVKAWEYPQWSGIMTSLLWWQCCTCQRWVTVKLSVPLSLIIFHSSLQKCDLSSSCDVLLQYFIIDIYWIFVLKAHREQCCLAEVPPNRPYCNVTSKVSPLTLFFSCLNRSKYLKCACSYCHSFQTRWAHWCGRPATCWPRSCWSWTTRALWTLSILPL